MTALREAVVLPLIFLTVALLGGLRIAARVQLVPPSLGALILALLLIAALVRGRVLAPDIFVNSSRRPLENMNGALVLVTLFAASAQVFNLLTPERGLLYALFSLFFGIQLLTSLAAIEERRPLLRALAVLFGAGLVLRFIVLEGLYGGNSTTLGRVLTVIAEGVTLGALDYEPNTAMTGYAAFVALVVYMIGLALLAPAYSEDRVVRGSSVAIVADVPDRSGGGVQRR